MQVDINGTVYDIGYNLEYAQTNADGAYQDKLKYRLVQQNNLFLQLFPAISRELRELRQTVDSLVTDYIWAADDDTIIAGDDDTILIFSTYFVDAFASLSERVSTAEENINQLADQGVLTYKEIT